MSASNAKPVGPAQAPIYTGGFGNGLQGFITPVSFAVDLSGVPRGEQVHLTISNLQGSLDPFAATYVSVRSAAARLCFITRGLLARRFARPLGEQRVML